MSQKTIKSKLYGGSFEDLSPELQELLSRRDACDSALDYPYPDDIVEDPEWYNAWIEWHESINTSEKRMDEQ